MPTSRVNGDPSPATKAQRISFDRFQLDLRSGELRKNGSRIRLQAQPFQLLSLLLEHPGEVVTREEIRHKLWNGDTFVDFDHSLSAAVNKVREALCDSAENPRFVETLPKRGYRFLGEIKLDVPEAAATSAPGVQPPAAQPRKAVWMAICAIAALVLIAAWFALRHAPHPTNFTPVPFTALPGTETAPAISPDGSRIVFAWDGGRSSDGKKGFDLYVKAIGSETLLRLTSHPSEWLSPVWSPDGSQIAFHRIDGPDTGIYVVPALGGPERRLRPSLAPYDLAAQLSWSPDGKWIAFSEAPSRPGDRLYLLSTETMESQPLPHDPQCLHEALVTFSHSGKQLASICVHNTGLIELRVRPLGGSPRPIASFSYVTFGLAWAPDDRGVIISEWTEDGPQLYEYSLADGASTHLSFASVGAWPNISGSTHKLAFSQGSASTVTKKKDLRHLDTPATDFLTSTRWQDDAQYSPDGKHIAFCSARSGALNVWMSDAEGNNLLQISTAGHACAPRWSPDSSRIAFNVHLKDQHEIYIADVRERAPRKLLTNVPDIADPDWSHDGRWIYFKSFEPIAQKIYRCPAAGGDATGLTSPGLDNVTAPHESLDGQRLYFMHHGGDVPFAAISLQPPFRESIMEPLQRVHDSGIWTVSREGIYFVPQENPHWVSFYEFATRQTRPLFKIDKDFAVGLSVSPDERYLLYSEIDRQNAEIILVNNFQ